MKIINCEQGSQSWFESRLGVPTASNFDKIITADGKPSKQAEKYMYQLAVERITGKKTETFKSAAMQEGNDREIESKMYYEISNGVTAEQVGFCLSDCGQYGCSPDALIGNDGILELKNPEGHTQISYLLKGGLEKEYFHQTQGQLFVTQRKWCDLMSYYPGLTPIVIRVFPDLDFHKKLEAELIKFTKDLAQVVKQIGG